MEYNCAERHQLIERLRSIRIYIDFSLIKQIRPIAES